MKALGQLGWFLAAQANSLSACLQTDKKAKESRTNTHITRPCTSEYHIQFIYLLLKVLWMASVLIWMRNLKIIGMILHKVSSFFVIFMIAFFPFPGESHFPQFSTPSIRLTYLYSDDGKKLETDSPALKTLQTENQLTCIQECTSSPKLCSSINFKKKTANSPPLCELFTQGRNEQGTNVKKVESFVQVSIPVSLRHYTIHFLGNFLLFIPNIHFWCATSFTFKRQISKEKQFSILNIY